MDVRNLTSPPRPSEFTTGGSGNDTLAPSPKQGSSESPESHEQQPSATNIPDLDGLTPSPAAPASTAPAPTVHTPTVPASAPTVPPPTAPAPPAQGTKRPRDQSPGCMLSGFDTSSKGPRRPRVTDDSDVPVIDLSSPVLPPQRPEEDTGEEGGSGENVEERTEGADKADEKANDKATATASRQAYVEDRGEEGDQPV